MHTLETTIENQTRIQISNLVRLVATVYEPNAAWIQSTPLMHTEYTILSLNGSDFSFSFQSDIYIHSILWETSYNFEIVHEEILNLVLKLDINSSSLLASSFVINIKIGFCLFTLSHCAIGMYPTCMGTRSRNDLTPLVGSLSLTCRAEISFYLTAPNYNLS